MVVWACLCVGGASENFLLKTRYINSLFDLIFWLISKVTCFDAKYLTNGYIYGHSYYRRRIGNRTQAFECHQFQWPWVTSKTDLKVTILFNVNGTRCSYSYNGGPIESRSWSIEPRHFKWLWTTPNPYFKVRHSLMLNICKMAKYTALVIM